MATNSAPTRSCGETKITALFAGRQLLHHRFDLFGDGIQLAAAGGSVDSQLTLEGFDQGSQAGGVDRATGLLTFEKLVDGRAVVLYPPVGTLSIYL